MYPYGRLCFGDHGCPGTRFMFVLVFCAGSSCGFPETVAAVNHATDEIIDNRDNLISDR